MQTLIKMLYVVALGKYSFDSSCIKRSFCTRRNFLSVAKFSLYFPIILLH